MSSDKSWIKLQHRSDPIFLNGLQNFMEIAMNHLDSEGKMYCPCKKCVNFKRHDPNLVNYHIRAHGFLSSYVEWFHHGEACPHSELIDALVNPSKPTSTSRSHPDLFDAIHDVVAERDTREETVDVDDVEDRNTTPGHDKEFDGLFTELNTELFPGCTWMSSLKFLATLMHIKVLNKWTNTSFNQLVEFLRDAFPKVNHVPESYNEAKKKLKKVGLGYQSIDTCVNDCALFWKENLLEEKCPVCGENRYNDDKKRGKKVPRKRMRYFPLTPRLRRMYACRFTAKDMVWHNTGRSADGMMRHPVDGKEWQEFNERYPDFAREPKNVRLGLAADGFNPFGNMSQSYSMWPVVLTTYNTPPWLCMKESSLMLALLIPGPKSPGKDIDVFLRPLVEELKMLWEKGVETRDASTDTVFNMRAALLWTINDYPARSSLSGWSGQGYKACPTCNEDTPSCRVNSKIAYVGHRRFLPTKHKFRDSLMFNGQKEKRKPPTRFTNAQILEQLETLPDRVPGKHPRHGGEKRKRAQSELNWTKRSIFYELDYWSSLKIKHNLDVMHIEKNVCESVLGTLLMNEKSKDTHKARDDLKQMGIRKDQWLTMKNNKVTQPQAPYSFTSINRERFCNFIKGVRLPDGFGSNFNCKVVGSNIIGLKSHDYHIIMQRLLPIGVRAGLGVDVSKTISDLCIFFKKLCARSVNVEDMQKTYDEVVKILCQLELIYPPAFFDIMVHVVLHLPEEAIFGGPVYMRWMYPFERYMKKLKSYVRNKARPEGSIAEGYVADEALSFCSMYLEAQPRRRGRGNNINLQREFEKNNGRKFKLFLDPRGDSCQFVGENQSYYIRCVSNCMARIPFTFSRWSNVPPSYKDRVFRELRNYFDIEEWEKSPQWKKIRLEINADCKSRFKDRKGRLKQYFLSEGGYEDVDEAKKHPPETHTQREWEKLIDEEFMDPNYIRQCLRNKRNRAAQKYQSLGGSQSLAQKRYLDVQAKGSYSPLEIWKERHFRNGEPENEDVARDWERIQETQTQIEKENPDVTIDEDQILLTALGDRYGWLVGQGRLTQKVSYDIGSSSSNERVTQLEETVRQLMEIVNQHDRTFSSMRSRQESGSSSQGRSENENTDQDRETDRDGDES